MSRTPVLLALSALFLHGAAAQNPRPAPAPTAAAGRWQVSAQTVYQQFNGLLPRDDAGLYHNYDGHVEPDLTDAGALQFLGPQVTAGFALTPRLALEAGLGVSINGWRTKVQPSLVPEWWLWHKYQIRSTNWTVPLRLRYELGRSTTKRLGCYVLAGCQALQQNTRYRAEPSAANPNPSDNGWSIHRDLPVALGLGVRCHLAAHWALTAEGQMAVSPRFLFENPYQEAASATPGAGASLGLRYCL